MRVGIDAHMVGARETGNETYVLGLIDGLARVDRDTRYTLYTCTPELARRGLADGGNLRTRLVRPAAAPVRIPLGLPAVAWRDRLDLLHTTYVAPPWSPCPTVVTVHDIAFRFFPETFSPRDRLILSTLVPFSARRATFVITVSEHSKRDLVRAYGLPPDRVVVTPEAARPRFHPELDPATVAAIRARHGLSRPFLLAVGTLQPRKNHGRLVEAYALLRAAEGIGHELVVVGRPGWRAAELFRQVQAAGLERDVRFLGYVPDADLPYLYAAADCLVHPSLYEGFGLPILEAMACGTPVVASNAASIPEVAGDAALLVDPYRADELAGAIRRVLVDGELRRRLRAAGLARARLYSWDVTARQTQEIYRQALARPAAGRPAEYAR